MHARRARRRPRHRAAVRAASRARSRAPTGARDFALAPPARTLPRRAAATRASPVHAVGKVARPVRRRAASTDAHPGATNAEALARDDARCSSELDARPRLHEPRRDRPGLRPPQGRRGLPRRAARDRRGGRRLAASCCAPSDLLVLTADHGVDPAAAAHRPHARARAAARALRRPRRPPPRRRRWPTSARRVLRWLTGRDAPALPGTPFVGAYAETRAMPELPEVETIRRQLAPLVEGRTLDALDDRRPALVRAAARRPSWRGRARGPARRAAAAARQVPGLGARATSVFLLMHLRMTGTLLYDPPPDEPLRARALRRSTTATTCASATRAASAPASWRSAATRSTRSSPRAWASSRSSDEFTAERLRRLARGRRAPIKAFLLDQRRVAGVGNIYADEALFRARDPPAAPGRRAEPRAVRGAARRGRRRRSRRASTRAARRSTTSATPTASRAPSRTSSSSTAARGEPCPACGGTIVKFVAAGRGTYACERCQKRPRARRRR